MIRKGLGEEVVVQLRGIQARTRIHDKTEVAMQGSGGKAFQTLRPSRTDVLRWQQRACLRLRNVSGVRDLGGRERPEK